MAAECTPTRAFPIMAMPCWWMAAHAIKVRGQMLTQGLRAIKGVNTETLHAAVDAYILTTTKRRHASNDPLELIFAQRLAQLVDIDDDPEDPERTYRAHLRRRLESIRPRTARIPLLALGWFLQTKAKALPS